MRLNATTVSYDPPSYSSLTPHDSISITSDSNFIDYGFPGSGTVEDPYVIEGFNITTTGSSGIYISGTMKYFTVRNCYVDAFLYGIYIYDVADGTATVINNTCNNNAYFSIRLYASGSSTVANNMCNYNGYSGIFLSSSGSSTVANNICNNNDDYGIYLLFSDNSTITNNTCSNNNNLDGIYLEDSGSSIVTNNTCTNNYEGIYLAGSDSSTVTNNTCSNNYRGINLDSSAYSTVANNTCSNNGKGIFLYYSDNSTVVNNAFTNCGLYIEEHTLDAYLSYTVENNWVNGKKIGFYTNLYSTIIAEPVYGQLILVNCTNVTVRDQILNDVATGLFLYSCTYSVIINNTCSNNNNWYGIYLYYSGYSTVANNTCSNNYWGIYLRYSDSSTVANNTCNNNYWKGIDLEDSGSSIVANNTCNNNYYGGIFLWFSGSSTVSNNRCNNNNNNYGIMLMFSGSSTIINNTCNNNYRGIKLSSSDFCVVTYNLLQENEGYGIYIESSSDNNHIHHNTFLDNNLVGTSQAYDEGTNNFWYDTEILEGNYWSDWSGIGSYSIDGPASSVDLFPLDEPTLLPIIAEYQLLSLFTLLIPVVPLLTIIFSRRRRKTA